MRLLHQLEPSLTIINQSASITSGEMNAVNIPEICSNTLSSKNDSRNFRFRFFVLFWEILSKVLHANRSDPLLAACHETCLCSHSIGLSSTIADSYPDKWLRRASLM